MSCQKEACGSFEQDKIVIAHNSTSVLQDRGARLQISLLLWTENLVVGQEL